MEWDPARYEDHRTQRGRAFDDLIGRVPEVPVSSVLDAGCGTGRTTHRLAARYPTATVLGVDASEKMLARAEAADRVSFAEADLANWRPEARFDLVVSNAVLHWIPQPGNMVRRIAAWVADEGVLALQVPANHDAPSHEAVKTVAASDRWKAALGDVRMGDHVLPLDAYARILHDAGFDVDAWETTYLHRLTGPDPVLHWLEGTTLRPHLAGLDTEDRGRFLADLAGPLAEAYPDEGGVTWFPFTRRFVVAKRRGRAASD